MIKLARITGNKVSFCFGFHHVLRITSIWHLLIFSGEELTMWSIQCYIMLDCQMINNKKCQLQAIEYDVKGWISIHGRL